ncbi:MAG: hypothetical protein U9Q70_12590 [Chloroflexota bacterium]|nr:hypothetical protein [Chloroflexota bacterium]
MNSNIFPILILNARPGAGKSEIIDYLTKTPLAERQSRFHVGKLDSIDDFPLLWTWFEEDALLNRRGYPRLHSDAQGYFKEEYFWHLLIERLGLEYDKRLRDHPRYQQQYTTLIEFSRGTEHGGYQAAYQHLSPQILQHGSLLYVHVSYAESLRKNRARANPARPDSLLEHSLSDEKLERLYREDDWETVKGDATQYLTIKGTRMPYAVFENEDDVTTPRGAALGERLEKTLSTLWERYRAR